jgi:hypothetical protein
MLVGLSGGAQRSTPSTRRSNDVLRGAYKAELRGCLKGVGQVIVSAQHVHFNNIPVADEAGNSGVFNVRASLAADGRFKGSGQAMGRPVSLSGRLEAADRTVRIGRLLCSFNLTGAGQFGRIMGEKQAGAPPQEPAPPAGGAGRGRGDD